MRKIVQNRTKSSQICPSWPKRNEGDTTIMCETCSKLTIKTPERRHFGILHFTRRHFGVFVVNFENILHIVLVFLVK